MLKKQAKNKETAEMQQYINSILISETYEIWFFCTSKQDNKDKLPSKNKIFAKQKTYFYWKLVIGLKNFSEILVNEQHWKEYKIKEDKIMRQTINTFKYF